MLLQVPPTIERSNVAFSNRTSFSIEFIEYIKTNKIDLLGEAIGEDSTNCFSKMITNKKPG
jgi:hypothetical protein